MNRKLAVVAMCVIVGGCSGNSKTGPSTAPTADTTARAVSVTLADLIAQGTSLQATATATLASGSTQAVSTGFKSDVPNVATVTDSGSVTAVSMGRANIYVVFGGQQGTKGIRVIPNYQGNWSGRWIVSGCTQTGIFATIDACSGLTGMSAPLTTSFTQSGETVNGRVSFGSFNSDGLSIPMSGDGSLVFIARVSSSDPIIDANITFLSSQVGQMTGTIRHTWTFAGLPGSMILTGQTSGVLTTSSIQHTDDPLGRLRLELLGRR